jgi:hypothetical protein
MLEEIFGSWRPFGLLPSLEFVQLMADFARILRVRREQEQDVMKQIVRRKDPTNDHRRPRDDPKEFHRATPFEMRPSDGRGPHR